MGNTSIDCFRQGLTHEFVVKDSSSRFLEITIKDDFLDSIPLKKIEGGNLNRGIYAFKNKSGESRIIKILEHKVGSNYQNEVSSYSQEIHSALLGENLGAPKIYHYGILKKWDGTEFNEYYYIEMEKLFSDDPGAVTFKDAYYNSPNPQTTMKQLSQLKENGKSVPEQIADLYDKLIEKRIDANDPDFMISSTGKVRWLDTGSWNIRNFREFKSSFSDSIASVYEKLGYHSEMAQNFLKNILEKIQQNSSLSSAEKEALFKEIKKSIEYRQPIIKQ